MKYSIFLISLLFSSLVSADVYQYCQTHVEIVKRLSTLSTNELIAKKSEVAKAGSIEELAKATGTDYRAVTSMLSKENITGDKANSFIMKGMKAFEIGNISLAINLKEVPGGNLNASLWNTAFDMCVENSRDQF